MSSLGMKTGKRSWAQRSRSVSTAPVWGKPKTHKDQRQDKLQDYETLEPRMN
jgi:hypothetical protein